MSHSFKKTVLAITALVAFPLAAMAQVTFYENEGFSGQTYTTTRTVEDFARVGFNDRASSVIVTSSRWEVCEGTAYRDRCVVLRPGRYPSLAAMGLNDRVSSIRALGANARINDDRFAPLPPAPSVVLYENPDFSGRSFTADKSIADMGRYGFNDRASSAIVIGDMWEACEDNSFRGQCRILRQGRYPNLAAMGMQDRISSVRQMGLQAQVDDSRFAPVPAAVYDSRRRGEERLFTADVTNVRAVLGTPAQRCWMEREEVPSSQNQPNVGGAIVGGLLGGILGHQVGGGVGKDLATVGGVVAGAAIGSRAGSNNSAPSTRDVQRCENQPANARPAYWDVTYNFRGQEHQVQMTSAPGATITVNAQGEPRT
ncbi:MAG: hypothetical protein CFE43_08940 [Burkholderiales bacterium PBB3]|nr:MAG: hypothetical protein CFE43_08940 [Burkholderiales bacterium PBB3]